MMSNYVKHYALPVLLALVIGVCIPLYAVYLAGSDVNLNAFRETLNNLPLQSAFHFPTDFFNLTVLFCVYGPISGPVLLISG